MTFYTFNTHLMASFPRWTSSVS